MTAMAERPALLRAARRRRRRGAAACALALAGGAAQAAAPELAADAATDPTRRRPTARAGRSPAGRPVLRAAAALQDLPRHASRVRRRRAGLRALGHRSRSTTRRTADPARRSPRRAPTRSRSSARWLGVARARPGPPRRARPRTAPPEPRTVARVPAPATLSRPSLDGDRSPTPSPAAPAAGIRSLDLAAGAASPCAARAQRAAHPPSLSGGRLLYVRTRAQHQQLLLGAASAERAATATAGCCASARRPARRRPRQDAHHPGPPAGDRHAGRCARALRAVEHRAGRPDGLRHAAAARRPDGGHRPAAALASRTCAGAPVPAELDRARRRVEADACVRGIRPPSWSPPQGGSPGARAPSSS